MAWNGNAIGMAWHGTARHGTARHGSTSHRRAVVGGPCPSEAERRLRDRCKFGRRRLDRHVRRCDDLGRLRRVRRANHVARIHTELIRRIRLKALHLRSEPYSRDSAVQPRRREPRRGTLPLSRSWCLRTPGRTGRAAPRLSAAPSAPSTCARTPKSRKRSRTGWAGAGSSRQAVKGVAVRLHRLTTALRLVPSDQQRVGLRFAR